MEPDKNPNDDNALSFAPRKLTLAENLILTMKIFLVGILILASVWGISIWKAAK